MPIAEMRRSDGRGVLAYAVKQGWVGGRVGNVEPGNVDITGGRATVVFVVDGTPTPAKLGLNREGGKWLIDLVGLIQMSNAVFRQRQEESGKSEDEYLTSMLQTLSKRPVPATIWDPPQ
jgi:hypothetical protein